MRIVLFGARAIKGGMNDTIIILIALTFALAGTVKGVTGMGLPTVAMGVLGALISPLAAASLLILPALVTNLWQLLAGPRLGGLVARMWVLIATSVAGTLVAMPLLTRGDVRVSTAALGAVLVGYGLYTLLAPPLRVPPRWERWLSPLVGLATGLIAGATGVGVMPVVPYLQALGLQRDDLVQALGLSFTATTLALAVGLVSRQTWQVDQLILSLLAIIPALIGMWLGQRLRRAISPATFRRCFLIALTLLGAEMLLRGLA